MLLLFTPYDVSIANVELLWYLDLPPVGVVNGPHVLVQVRQHLIANITLFPDPFVNHGYVRLQTGSGSEYFAAVGTGVAVVLDTVMDNLDVPIQVPFFAEHFAALGTGGWFMDLDVEVNLFYVPVEGALLAEDVGTVGADDPLHLMLATKMLGQVLNLLIALGAGELSWTNYMNF